MKKSADKLGQLTTVKNASGTTVYSYTYDGAGNILTATENGTTVSYTYGDSGWQDLLTAYNGQEITYDAIGNPTSYRGWTLGWQNGRQLATAAKSGKSVSYAYDVNGIRASKTVDGVKHTYVYDGTQLLAERYGTTRLEFMYNESGQPHLVRYSTNSGSSYVTYYYILNQQGDVMALMDTAGELAVKYTYDPWGKVLTVTNGSGTAITSATHIANVNPIRYRSYYYDADTQLYYLQSRYYDPEVSRFLNADAAEFATLSTVSLSDTNLFAYCANDPVNKADPTGTLAAWIATLAAGAVVGAISSAVSTVVTNAIYGNDLTEGLGKSILIGAAKGAFYATPVGKILAPFAQAVESTIIGMQVFADTGNAGLGLFAGALNYGVSFISSDTLNSKMNANFSTCAGALFDVTVGTGAAVVSSGTTATISHNGQSRLANETSTSFGRRNYTAGRSSNTGRGGPAIKRGFAVLAVM